MCPHPQWEDDSTSWEEGDSMTWEEDDSMTWEEDDSATSEEEIPIPQTRIRRLTAMAQARLDAWNNHLDVVEAHLEDREEEVEFLQRTLRILFILFLLSVVYLISE